MFLWMFFPSDAILVRADYDIDTLLRIWITLLMPLFASTGYHSHEHGVGLLDGTF